jgi:tetratricopeptide (TPR) repeat protein
VLAERRTQLLLLAVVGLTLIAWGGVPWGTFQFDDFTNVVRDPATTDLAALLERLPHGLRPLTRLSYAADAHVFGMHAAGFLTTNLLLHLVTVLLVYALARRRVSAVGACVAAAVFSVQPANAEVVAYVSGRSTGLMAPLVLAALLQHDRGRRGWAVALFALACMAKEVALVFPALVLVWEVSRTERRAGVARELGVYAVVAVVLAGMMLALANYRAILGYSYELRPVGDNVLANGRAIPIMVSLWLRPWALSPDHDFDATGHLVTALAGLALLAGVLALGLNRRRFALALAWPIVALLPTCSVIAKIDLVTEKPLYLAWVGPAIAIGIATSGRSRLLVALLVCALALASARRAAQWRDPVGLWEDAVAQAPTKARCWNNLGMTYLGARRDAEAVTAFEHALRLDPEYHLAAANLELARMLSPSAE